MDVYQPLQTFAPFLDAIAQPLFVHNKDFEIVYANLAYCKLVKKRLSALIGHPYWETFPNFHERPTDNCLKTRKNHLPQNEMLEIVPGQFYFSYTFLIEFEGKEFISFHLLENISKEKALLEGMPRGQAELKAFLEGMPYPAFVHDMDGKFVEVNSKVCKKLGYSRKRLLTMSAKDIEDQYASGELEKLWKKVQAEKSFTVFGQLKKSRGLYYPAKIHLASWQYKNKNLIIVMAREISEHVRLQENLKRRFEFDKLVREISERLNDVEHLQNHIEHIVQWLGKYSEVSRCYFLKYDEATDMITYGHEWCAPHVKSLIDDVQGLPFSTFFPWLSKCMKAFKIIEESDINRLPKLASYLKNELKRDDVASILINPVFTGKRLWGMLGFDVVGSSLRWEGEDVELLIAISRLLAQAFLQEESIKKDILYQENLELMLISIVMALVNTIEQRDPYTAGHQLGVATLAKAIALEMNMDMEDVKLIYLGGLLHDVGKIHIPAEILSSPNVLSKEEFELIKTHPQKGYDIVKDLPLPNIVKEIVFMHHEHLNGAGYPRGLKGKDIPLAVRIVTVADVYESMQSHRPYRPARSDKEAREELINNAGKLYDRKVVDACLAILKKGTFQFPTIKTATKLWTK